jgi:signal transduction histidine kinase
MSEAPDLIDKHILVVEDSTAQAFKLRHFLLQHFSRATVASHGEEALAVIESEPPDLVLSDVNMPVMHGYELCRRIRADTRFAALPVILITGLNDPVDAIQGLQCGANAFLTKPYEEDQLLARIQFLLANTAMRETGGELHPETGVEFVYGGKRYFIASERDRVLDLLLSTYEIAMWKSRELQCASEKLEAQADELRRSNRELEQFASVASHDLQEPLRMVTSYLTLLERRLGDRLEEKEKAFFGFAVDGAKRMQQMITDLLAYARAGIKERELHPVDLEKIFAGALANLSTAAAEKYAVITHDPLPTLCVEAPRFAQLFQNLLGNALKFTVPGRPPKIHLGCAHEGNCWHFQIRDNGIGIPAADFDRVFVLFQRLHSREEYPGTGMGLSLCQKIVERHGGRIWLESEEGQGTTIHFTIPA